MLVKRIWITSTSSFAIASTISPLFFLFKSNESKKDLSIVQSIDNEYDEDFDFEKIKEQAHEAFRKMDDYSFRVFLPCGKIGTAWILDYEIPTNSNDYPTKWYIATNAHVANQFRFIENPYNQELPIPEATTKQLRKKSQNQNFSHLPLNSTEICEAQKNYGYFDFNLSRHDSWERLKSNFGAIKNGKMKEPNLFYVPINFLEKEKSMGIEEDNYKDFAVIEVEFTTPQNAKEATGDFFGKYKAGSKDAINVFADPLEKQKSWEEIEKSFGDYYSLAYPYKEGDNFSYTTNFDDDSGDTSILSWDRNGFSNVKKVRGYVSASAVEKSFSKVFTEWNGRNLKSVGNFYLLENFSMNGGASGALVIDKNGNVLGIRSIGDSKNGSDQFGVVPLRSTKINKEGILSPEYDLILGGVKGQKTSYRQKIEELGRKTFLSQSGWKHGSKKE